MRWSLAIGLIAVGIGWARWSRIHSQVRSPLGNRSRLESAEAVRRQAVGQLEACWLFCDAERRSVDRANSAMARVLERRAEREHYRQRERAEVQRARAREARRMDQIARVNAQEERVAHREHQRQLELLQLQTKREQQVAADRRERQLRYFEALGPEGRLVRLQRCHRAVTPCDEVVSQLLVAAATDDERMELARRHEQFLAPPTESVEVLATDGPARSSQAPAAPSSQVEQAVPPSDA